VRTSFLFSHSPLFPLSPPAPPTSHLQPSLRTYAAEKAKKDPGPLPRGPRWLVAHQRRLEERRPSVGSSSWYTVLTYSPNRTQVTMVLTIPRFPKQHAFTHLTPMLHRSRANEN
jgi:hypothetical protein